MKTVRFRHWIYLRRSFQYRQQLTSGPRLARHHASCRGNVVVEEMRGKLAVKRILRMDEHVRLRKSHLLSFHQDNRCEPSAQQASVDGFTSCPKHTQTREQCPLPNLARKSHLESGTVSSPSVELDLYAVFSMVVVHSFVRLQSAPTKEIR